MKDNDIEIILNSVAPVMREFVSERFDGLLERVAVLQVRLAAVEQRALLVGPRGEPGEPGLSVVGPVGATGERGESVSVDDVVPLIVVEVEKAVAALPPVKDGAPGEPGMSVDLLVVEAMVTKAVSVLPVPKDGKSLTPDDVAPLIASEVIKAVAALPVPADPVGVVGALLNREGHLVVTLSNGSTKDVGLVVGKDVDPADVVRVIGGEVAKFPRPKDGADGKDGLGFDDLDVVFIDERAYLRFTRGEQVKQFLLHVPAHRDTWQPNIPYLKGDVVIWDGSWWIAKSDADNIQPGAGKTPWRLTVKHGKDGKIGPTGAKGLDGKPGLPGRDGRTY